jgi:integrase
MVAKKIDIHNFKQREISIRNLLEKSEISGVNKKLIFDFVDELSLTVKIGIPRRIKLISTLKQLALNLNKDFDKVINKDLEKIVSNIQSNEEYSPWTVSDYNKILKKFYKWLIPKKNLLLNVDWINGTLKERDIPKLKRGEMITEEEAHKLVELSENPRNKGIFSLIWDAGARIGELGSMTIGSVHFEDQGTVVDFSGKTGKRSAFIIESTPFLSNWINLHPFKDDPNAPLWISMNQNPKYKYQALSYRMYYKMFERAFKRAKIKKKFNPHLFRHSRALWCAQNNWNQVMANKMFGWGMSSIMYNYYVSLATEDIKEKMLECYGISNKNKEDIDKRKPNKCPRCEALNDNKSRFCYKCGLVLDMETAKELMKKKELEKELQDELLQKTIHKDNIPEFTDVKELMYQILKKDKTLINKLKEIVS